MANLENDLIEIEEDLNIYEDPIEEITPSDEKTEYTWEEVMDLKKKAERLDKAEKKLVELKKANKEKPKIEDNEGEVYTKQDAMLDKFINKNPSLEGYEAELKEYLKKGNSIEEAKILVENKDKTIQNRQKINSMNITTGESAKKTTYTKAEIAEMPQSKYNEVMRLKEEGKIFIKS